MAHHNSSRKNVDFLCKSFNPKDQIKPNKRFNIFPLNENNFHTEMFLKKNRFGMNSPKTKEQKESAKPSIKSVQSDLEPSEMFNFSFQDLSLESKINHFWKQFLDYVQNNNNNCGILKLVKKERLKKDIFEMIDETDKDLVMQNFNVFRALVFQKIIYPELLEKKKSLLKNESDISTLIECLNDSTLFLISQKRFGYKTADPKELKKKGFFKLLPFKGLNSPSRNAQRRKQLIKSLTNKFGFTFDEDTKPKPFELIKENSFKAREYYKMTSMKSLGNTPDNTCNIEPIMKKIEEGRDFDDEADSSPDTFSNRHAETPAENNNLRCFRNKQKKVHPSKFKSSTRILELCPEKLQKKDEKVCRTELRKVANYKSRLKSRIKIKPKKPQGPTNSTITECLSMIMNKINSREKNILSLKSKSRLRSISPLAKKIISPPGYKKPTCSSNLRNFHGKIQGRLPQFQKLVIKNCNMKQKPGSPGVKSPKSAGIRNFEERIWIKKLKKNMYFSSM
ncbi:unnamed protein product [Moneuplotes crassus]|uniref:Uncharacterized protein n=1 Tax=Euplotes crassus TaxID=5936 RepID=A0AAD2D4Y0_EUPCR|nr:unnamed protein product [Moneuplotes crassus]